MRAKQQQALNEDDYINTEIAELNQLYEFGADGVAAPQSMQRFQDAKLDLTEKDHARKHGRSCAADAIAQVVKDAHSRIPTGMGRDMLQEFDKGFNADLDLLMADPSTQDAVLNRLQKAYDDQVLNSQQYNQRQGEVRQIMDGTFRDTGKAMTEAINRLEDIYLNNANHLTHLAALLLTLRRNCLKWPSQQ